MPTGLEAGFLQVYAFSGEGAAAAATPLFPAGTIEARGRFATGTKAWWWRIPVCFPSPKTRKPEPPMNNDLRPRVVRTLIVLAAVLAAPLAAVTPPYMGPLPDQGPGATLLIPYAEVDLDAPDGRTTLFTVANTDDQPVLAHAVLWTDWGIPAYGWDIYLGPNAVQSYNLRDLVAYGRLPATGDPAGPSGHCSSPIATPGLEGEDLLTLQRRLTGRPDAANGLCWSEPRQDSSLATGTITIDVVKDCSQGAASNPTAAGYFNGPAPLAGSREALWGDYTLADPAADYAQGFEAYSLGVSDDYPDSLWFGRENLDLLRESHLNCSRIRFLRGGPFAASTSFFLYSRSAFGSDGDGNYGPAACQIAPSSLGLWTYSLYDEAGRAEAYLRAAADEPPDHPPNRGRRRNRYRAHRRLGRALHQLPQLGLSLGSSVRRWPASSADRSRPTAVSRSASKPCQCGYTRNTDAPPERASPGLDHLAVTFARPAVHRDKGMVPVENYR